MTVPQPTRRRDAQAGFRAIVCGFVWLIGTAVAFSFINQNVKDRASTDDYLVRNLPDYVPTTPHWNQSDFGLLALGAALVAVPCVYFWVLLHFRSTGNVQAFWITVGLGALFLMWQGERARRDRQWQEWQNPQPAPPPNWNYNQFGTSAWADPPLITPSRPSCF